MPGVCFDYNAFSFIPTKIEMVSQYQMKYWESKLLVTPTLLLSSCTATGIKRTASHSVLTDITGLSLSHKWMCWIKQKKISWFSLNWSWKNNKDGPGVSHLPAKLCSLPGEGSFRWHPKCACTAVLIELLLILIRGPNLIPIMKKKTFFPLFYFFQNYLALLYIRAKFLHMAH